MFSVSIEWYISNIELLLNLKGQQSGRRENFETSQLKWGKLIFITILRDKLKLSLKNKLNRKQKVTWREKTNITEWALWKLVLDPSRDRCEQLVMVTKEIKSGLWNQACWRYRLWAKRYVRIITSFSFALQSTTYHILKIYYWM